MQSRRTSSWSARHAAIFEYFDTPAFWYLGIFLAIQWFATKEWTRRLRVAQEERATAPQEQIQHQKAQESPSAVNVTFWLAPYLTSRFRIAVLFTVYLIIFGLHVLEGYWIMVTAIRFTTFVWGDMLGADRSFSWPQKGFALLIMGSILYAEIVMLIVAGMVLRRQWLYVAEVSIELRTALRGF